MNDVITLDLGEVADEWQERIDEMSSSVPDTEGMSWGEVGEATTAFLAAPEQVEFVAPYVKLCQELGGDPCEPATLHWLDRQGLTLIREDTFTEYAREYAEDIYGEAAEALGWCVNWERFAESMRQDYYSVEYDGHTWLRRA